MTHRSKKITKAAAWVTIDDAKTDEARAQLQHEFGLAKTFRCE